MKKNFYYLSLILGLVFGMMMFTACGGGDDGNGNDDGDNGQTTNNDGGGSSTPQEDYGTDGLKGYWVQNEWHEYICEQTSNPEAIGFLDGATTGDNYDGFNTNISKGLRSRVIFLDGEGGGRIYLYVTTLDKVNNNSKYVAEKLGTFQDISDGMTKDYYFPKTFYHLVKYNINGEWTLNAQSPINYYLRGTTMSLYYFDSTESMQLNVSSGYVTGYHRLKKVD